MGFLTFGWATPFIKSSFSTGFSSNDISYIQGELSTSRRYNPDRLLRDLLMADKWNLIFSAVIFLASNITSLYAVIIMKDCIRKIKEHATNNGSFQDLAVQLTIYFLIQLLTVVLNCHGEYLTSRQGIRSRHNLTCQLYSSVQARSPSSSLDFVEGALLNAMTTDMSAVENAFSCIHFLWAAPLQCCLILWSLYQMIGVYSMIGIVIMFVYTMVQWVGLSNSKYYRQRYLKWSDKRIESIKSYLSCIKVIKAIGLEALFTGMIQEVRAEEVSCLRRDLSLRAFAVDINALFSISATTCTVLLLKYHNAVDFATILAVIALLKKLRHQLNMIPIAVTAWNDCRISIERIKKFMEPQNSFACPISVDLDRESISLRVNNEASKIAVGSIVCVEGSIKYLLEGFNSKARVAFCSEVPWIQSTSIRENILFGQPFDLERYNTVLSVCEMLPDLEVLSDIAPLGDQGSNLSGGQRARVALARALYSDAKVMILEDVTKSLDVGTSEKIAERLKSWKPGDVTIFFTGPLFNCADLVLDLASLNTFALLPCMTVESTNLTTDQEERHIVVSSKASPKGKATISNRVLKDWYHGAGGPWLVVGVVILKFVIHQSRLNNDVKLAKDDLSRHELTVFLVCCISQIALPLCHTIMVYLSGLQASSKLHSKTTRRIFLAPLIKHTSSSSDKITSRLGKDQEYADISLPIYVNALSTASSNLIFTCYGIVMKNWIMLLPLVVLFICYYWIVRICRRCSRAVRREESACRNLICSASRDAVQGLLTIRGHHKEQYFATEMRHLSLHYTGIRLLMLAIQVWFSLRVKIMGNIGTFVIGLAVALARMNPEMAALIFSYSIDLPGMVLWTFRQFGQTESHMISYEKIFELGEEYIPESLAGSEGHEKLCISSFIDFSMALGVKFVNVCAFFESTPFLRSVNLDFPAGSKTCLVGRTGSGKSSLLLTLLRIYDVQSGEIYINGSSISEINRELLRASIDYVPQEPLIFSNHSVRFNLDPTGSIGDAEMWSLLKILNAELVLDEIITEELHISIKEKICMARGILRRNKLLLLDEPLASLDSKALQSIISSIAFVQYLKGVTVIIVSHRDELVKFCQFTYKMSEGRIL